MRKHNHQKKIITTVAQLINALYQEVDNLEITQKEKTLLVYYMANDILERNKKNKTAKDFIFHHPSPNRVISSQLH